MSIPSEYNLLSKISKREKENVFCKFDVKCESDIASNTF